MIVEVVAFTKPAGVMQACGCRINQKVEAEPSKHVANCSGSRSSEQVGFLHDTEELLLVNFSITVAVCLINHLLKLFVRHSLSELFGDSLKILEGDLASLVIVEEAEGLEDLVLGVTVQ